MMENLESQKNELGQIRSRGRGGTRWGGKRGVREKENLNQESERGSRRVIEREIL